jgi:N-acetylglucosaminyldiphosphoundecaprenol N-acetyl-beta-D-mannosaminyltransferase
MVSGKKMSVELLGIYFDAVTREQMVQKIDYAIFNSKKIWLTFINVDILIQAYQNPDKKGLLDAATFKLCDGMGIFYATKILGKPLPESVNGPLMLFRLLEYSSKQGYSIYLLGSTKDIIGRVNESVQRKYPGIRVQGYHNGYFSEVQEKDIVEEINKNKPQILIVGMGFPREREFIMRHKEDLEVPVCMDVGGAFTVLGGVHQLAPAWVRTLGLEWTFRLIQEPKRLWKRYFKQNMAFGYLMAKELLFRSYNLIQGMLRK